ncbi:Protein LEG1 like [Pseudolycoriella hygida]|uniref:Protein LEG1 like n=1 Tax=Pseudolycoriella hygida TaxID=35572 RepID=A0A9Q0S2U9_9DIPT|nr:Protein LEG1 like [Pseudolycoriella hygida]
MPWMTIKGNLGFADAATVIDPWVISEREAVSAAIVDCTKVPALFGEDNRGNVAWGLDIQTNWQIESGRQGPRTSGRVDEFAWFAGINYHLTAVPYIAAMKSNLLPPAEFLPPKSNSADKFPTVYEQIDSETAEIWTEYFETIKHLQNNSTYTTLNNVQRLMWDVHNITVSKALKTFEPELQLLNVRERQFANGFGHSVEVLAMFNLNTGYSTIYSLNQMFPHRVLRLLDLPPLIFGMSIAQNTMISLYMAIDQMVQLNVWTDFVETLRDAMAIGSCAVKLQKTFTNYLSSPKGNLITLLTTTLLTC